MSTTQQQMDAVQEIYDDEDRLVTRLKQTLADRVASLTEDSLVFHRELRSRLKELIDWIEWRE